MSAAKGKSLVFETTRRVEFRDTDAAGIVHFSVFFTYMEQAEHAFLRHLGIRLFDERDGRGIGWPRVAASCDYLRPITFEDEISIAVTVVRIGRKSVTYRFQFRHEGHEVASGQVTAACCEAAHDGMPLAVPIPVEIVERLTPYLVVDHANT